MSETTYTILPGTLRTAWNPVARFFHTEDGFDDPWQYDVTAGPDGFYWQPGHNPVRLAISPEQEAEAWERARLEGARMLAEFDKQDF